MSDKQDASTKELKKKKAKKDSRADPFLEDEGSFTKPEAQNWIDLAREDYASAEWLFKGARHPLDQYLKRLSEQIAVGELIVFGSHSYGAPGEESDIDVLVVSDDFRAMKDEARYEAVYNAALDIEPDIHPWPVTKAELKSASKLTAFGHARDHGIRVGGGV